MKLISIFILCILFYGCANKEKVNKTPNIIKEIMHNYFGSYEYIYQDIGARGNSSGEIYALIEIDKNKISLNEMHSIVSKLVDNGWRIVGKKHNYYELCQGDKESLDILFPVEIREYTSNGIPIDYNNMDAVNIFYYKSSTVIANCNKNLDNIVNFNNL